MNKKYFIQLLPIVFILATVSTLGNCEMKPDTRKNDIINLFAEHPEYFPEKRRSSILNGIVTLGMTPYEAKLAGGAFFYAVTADKSKWPDGSDPLDVMWAQSMNPDNSEIKMTFKNASQFPKKDETSFCVYFKNGHAIKIEKLTK